EPPSSPGRGEGGSDRATWIEKYTWPSGDVHVPAAQSMDEDAHTSAGTSLKPSTGLGPPLAWTARTSPTIRAEWRLISA
ncbi:hypothetical protein, partial [Pseudomonas sp. GW704-F3]|uniref:hypothetical protein n=1 Tax=Pseudomonas sp. GW704-F3 TaxID=2070574 RepID=UPI001C487C8A